MRKSDLVSLSTDNLLVIRNVYCKDIIYLKKTMKDKYNDYIDYVNHLENEIHSINLELIDRGIVK